MEWNTKRYVLPMVYVNNVGAHTELIFDGGSLMYNSSGELVAELKYFEEDFVLAELDMDDVRRARLFTPVLRDERLDLTLRELTRIIKERKRFDQSDAD